VRIDHVILAAADLDAAAARLRAEHGLVAAGGGRHAGIGTHNRIVPLGDGYLELVGIADRREAERSPFGRGVLHRLATAGDGLVGWVVAVDDVTREAARLGTEVTTIARAGLTARLTGVTEAMAAPLLPFFLTRDPGVADPGAADPGAAARACGITGLTLSGDAGRLRDWLGPDGDGLPLEVTPGPPALLAVTVGDRLLR
jgi:hypothetical protein